MQSGVPSGRQTPGQQSTPYIYYILCHPHTSGIQTPSHLPAASPAPAGSSHRRARRRQLGRIVQQPGFAAFGWGFFGEGWRFFLFVSLFLSPGLSLGTLVFVLGERCGGGPCPRGTRGAAAGALSSRRTRGSAVPEHKCSSEPPRASRGSGEASGPAERLPGPATASFWLPWPRSDCGTDPSQPRARASNGRGVRARSFKPRAGAAPDLARRPGRRALVPARWRRGWDRAGQGDGGRPVSAVGQGRVRSVAISTQSQNGSS